MAVCMYRDIHTLQPYVIDFTQRGCHTLRLCIRKISRLRLQKNVTLWTEVCSEGAPDAYCRRTDRQAYNTQKLKDLTIVTWQQSTPLPVGFVTTSSALRYTFSKFHFYVGNAACWSTEPAVSIASRQNRRRNQYRVRCASKLFECCVAVTLRKLGPTACLTFCAVLPTVQIFPHFRPFLAHDEAYTCSSTIELCTLTGRNEVRNTWGP